MFISLDLETTGFDHSKDQIIEFGAIKFDITGKEIAGLQFLCNPGFSIPQIVTHITKITDQDVKDTDPFHVRKEDVQNFIGTLPIIGHNIQFDTNFLKSQGLEVNNLEYDTHDLAGMLLTGLPSYSLEVLTQIFKLTHQDKHRALDDAIAAKELFLKLIDEFTYLPPSTITQIQELSQKSAWPLKELFKDLKPQKGQRHQYQTEKNKSSEPITDYQKIITTEESSLFEANPPYHKLVKDLLKEISPNTYIALPFNSFREIEQEIPDNFAKIDSPKNYISLQRLEEFSQKNFYENDEILTLCKLLIWSEETNTGLLSEVRLKGEEIKNIQQVNINESIGNSEEEKFYKKALEKDAEAAAVCTHQYIIEFPPKGAEVIILDLDQFFYSLNFNLSIYLTLDNILIALEPLTNLYPENKALEMLNSKATILFGIIGIIFEKGSDDSPYIPRSTINQNTVNSREWQNAKESVNNLTEISKELGEINNEKTKGYLQKWKQVLRSLHEIFFDQELLENMTWIEQNMQQNLAIRKQPTSTHKKFQEILETFKNYKIVNEIFDLEDEGKFTKKIAGLDQSLVIHKITTKPQNLEISIIEDVNAGDKNQLVHFFLEYLPRAENKTAIIFNSKKELEFLTLKLSQAKLPIISQSTGSTGKVRQLIQEDKNNSTILVTHHTWQNLENHEGYRNVFIHKTPFDHPNSPEIVNFSKNYNNPFMELQVPRALINLHKDLNRLVTTAQKHQVHILDPRLTEKAYGQTFIDSLKKFGPVNILKLNYCLSH